MAETSYQTTKPFFEKDVKKLIEKGWGYADKPYEAYGGERVAGLTGDQQQAFSMTRDAAGGDYNVGEAESAYRGYGGEGAQTIDIGRLIDEGGGLGAVSDYMDPYLAEALQPTLDQIRESGALDRQQISAAATGAGAFGDARHGVLESEQRANQQQLIGDTTNQAYSDAFNRAMSMRASDQGRMMEGDQFNANAVERSLDRLLGSGKALEGAGETDLNSKLKQIQALIASGTTQRNIGQAELDTDYEEFLRSQDEELKDLNTMLSLLSGSSSQTPVTTTTSQPEPEDNGIFGGVGGLINGLIGSIF